MSEAASLIFEPMPGKVVVETVGHNEKIGELGLILAPPTRDNPRTTGRVVAIYEAFLLEDGSESTPYVAKGDIVMFGKYSGTEIEHRRKKYIVLRESDILTKVRTDSTELSHLEAEPVPEGYHGVD